MTKNILTLVRSQGLAFLALMLVLSGSVAYASATVAKNSVVSKSIRNGEVKTVDLRNEAVKGPKIAPDAVTGAHVGPDALTGDDLAESTLGQVPDAGTLNGFGPGAFLRSAVYKKEVGPLPGNDFGDGTFTLALTCDPGDILLSGGPANVLGTSDLVESFPSPGTTNGWSVRIHKNGFTDAFSVVILCVNQV